MARSRSRRWFLTAGGSAAFVLWTPQAKARPVGANDRLKLGFIGVGNRGTQLLRSFLKIDSVEVVSLCDVDSRMLRKARTLLPHSPRLCKDFRTQLEMKDIDGVVIATPDHWHALQTIMACQAGKDVYVEKPLSITIVEGRAMVNAARKYKRVVQVGTHRRSSELYRRVVRFVQSGGIGKVTVSRAYRLSNMYPKGMGRARPSTVPAELDWDLWLGPRPYRPYQANIHPYKFRWWNLYSSQVANWGVHYFDAIRWVIGERAPRSLCALGGKFAVQDDRTIPDTLQVIFEMPGGSLVVFGQYEACGNPARRVSCDIEVRGTRGTAFVSAKLYKILPEKGGQFQDPAPRMKPLEVASRQGDLTDSHTRNFVNCMWSRKKPAADIEEGHLSTTFSLLANISLAVRARLQWDPDRERILEPKEANAFLHYQYRPPWKLPS